MKKWMILALSLIMAAAIALPAAALRLSANDSTTENSRILGIESSHFFNDISGTVFIYFGRPTCPECVDFEPHLLKFLEETDRVVYYYNTSYWKDDPQYEQTLEQYHVDTVPLLVKTVGGAYRDAYQFDPDASAEEIATQLGTFFPARSNLFPVTEAHDFPIQFHSSLFAFTFLMMCANTAYVILRRKELVHSQASAPLIWVIVNGTLLLALHAAIAGFGFSFAMQYEANPDTSLLAVVGTNTWLTVTPVLYLIMLWSCLNIKIKQHALRTGRQ